MALMHLKVMRAYIDGVLRFGIPPKFYLGIVKPGRGKEKSVLHTMTEAFIDPSLKEMYGSKEDANDAEDFFPFVSI
jgi:V-type H+-transporting ATPase subunit C